MVKQLRMLAIVLSLCATPFFVCAESRLGKRNLLENHPHLKKFCASYLATVLLGSGIGVTTSTLLTYAEKALIQYIKKHHRIDSFITILLVGLLGWSLESEIRNDVVAGVQGDLDAYQIPYKKNLMFRSASVASWLNYLRSSYILET